jgi:polar amino acid transport system substrate-binding protein
MLTVVAAVVFTACSGSAAGSPVVSADPTTDKLAQVLARGTLVLSMDPAYAPQSSSVDGATRAPETLCSADQLTAREVEGYDTDTGKLVAEALGVEPCFVTPPWNEIIAGRWADRWDIAWGSGALTEERMTRLYVTQPYYSTPHNFFVPTDSPITSVAELDGKRIGACSGCTHELYLQHTLELPGVQLDFAVDDAVIVAYDAEPAGLEATAAKEIDAFLCGEPVGAAAIADGLALRMLPEPAYVTQKTGYADRGSSLAMGPFLERVDSILRDLHGSGALRELSMKYFGRDYATDAGTFDLTALDQAID